MWVPFLGSADLLLRDRNAEIVIYSVGGSYRHANRPWVSKSTRNGYHANEEEKGTSAGLKKVRWRIEGKKVRKEYVPHFKRGGAIRVERLSVKFRLRPSVGKEGVAEGVAAPRNMGEVLVLRMVEGRAYHNYNHKPGSDDL